MATFRLGYCGFGDLTVGSALAGAAGNPAPGAVFALAAASPLLTPLLVEAVGPGAQVAAGSGFGAEGQPVTIDCRVTAVAEGASAREVTVDVLSLGGIRVGLVAGDSLSPGAIYRVTDAAGIDTLAALQGYPQVSGQAPGETVFCFAAGTLVDTPDGPRPIEALRPGDLVTTLGNGSQPLRWAGRRHVPLAELLRVPDLQPVAFAAGAIGNTRPLRVSPAHRILLNDWRAQVFFGEDEVLIPARAMVNDRAIRPVLPAGGVTYVHLLFDRHEIILSEGALSESFHPGEAGLLALDGAERRELDLLFPGQELLRRRAAFPVVQLSEARALRLPD